MVLFLACHDLLVVLLFLNINNGKLTRLVELEGALREHRLAEVCGGVVELLLLLLSPKLLLQLGDALLIPGCPLCLVGLGLLVSQDLDARALSSEMALHEHVRGPTLG